MILPIIMAGGSGSRLWPLSRALHPKQFLSLVTNKTMLQDTVNRLNGVDTLDPIVICNEEHRFLVAEQLRSENISHNGIILEPVGRNTAPAIAVAALKAISDYDEDPLILVLAADHVILNNEAFISSINNAVHHANSGKLVTFGIVPTHPETGYGYIRRGVNISDYAYKVDSFVEKPNLHTAQSYLNEGGYYWNSGMFMFRASKYLQELENHQPEIISACNSSFNQATLDLEFIRLERDSFESCPDDSIDYAVMEKTEDAVVVPMDASWSDVGSWSAIWDVNHKDVEGNVLKGDVLINKTSNSYISSQSKLIATVGVDNLVIVETKDAVLVADKDKVQDVKNIVSDIKTLGRTEHLQHREVYRPWGNHDTIAEGDKFNVKKVTIKPSEKTATQLHYHRSEHWVVVSGTAKVKKGDEFFIISENESIFIPLGIPHSIENPGTIPLVIIEVRTGSYLKEDDVVRIEEYGEGY